jgi:hypothetical protein
MSGADEPRQPESDAEQPATESTAESPTESPAESPAESAAESPAEPSKAPDGRVRQTEAPADQDGLADELLAAGARWASGNDHLVSEGMRSLGVKLDAPIRAKRALGNPADIANLTGAKIASGNGMAIEQVTYNVTGAAPSQASSGHVNAALVKSIVDTYAPTADHDAVRDTLVRYGVVYVSGAEDSGRMTTAYAVLAELCGHDKIIAVDQNGAELAAVLMHGDLLRAGHGHVVELPATGPAPRKQTLATAGGQFADTHFYLVVVGPAGPTEHALHPYEVRHQAPAPADVLDWHLPHQLGNRTNWSPDQITAFVATCRHAPGIAERLRSSWQPGEVEQLARRLVDVGLRGGQPDEALRLLPSALRELAVNILRDANVDGDVHTLRRLTARIAFGLFSDRPLTVVFELASMLFAALSPKEQTSSTASAQLVTTVFDGGMESLIDERMRARPNEDDTDGAARLVDPELALALLDVVWHDYDHLRAPLIDWLFVLGGDPRQQVCVRAGQLAGQLALYDFGTVYRELLRPLARSNNKVRRQTAAWAMERAVLEPKLTARVCLQVQVWTTSPDPFLNDAAARAYATRLGVEFAREPLVHLWLVAMGGEQVVSSAVAAAVARLDQPDDPESTFAILTMLATWTGDRTRSLHVHAARAVTLLADRTASPPHDRWPALLRQAAERQETRDLLVELWRAALTEPMVAVRGWQALLKWLLMPDEIDELHEFTVAFATELVDTPLLRARAVFHLSQWRHRHHDAPVLRRLRDNI